MLKKPDIPDWNNCVAVEQQPLIISGLRISYFYKKED